MVSVKHCSVSYVSTAGHLIIYEEYEIVFQRYKNYRNATKVLERQRSQKNKKNKKNKNKKNKTRIRIKNISNR